MPSPNQAAGAISASPSSARGRRARRRGRGVSSASTSSGGLFGADCWRQGVECNALLGFALVLCVPGLAVALALAALDAFLAIAPAALGTLGWLGVAIGFGLGALEHLVVAVAVGIFIPAAALLIEADAAFAQHAEIMVRELQVIFGLDAIPCELRVTRQALVFFEQLGGIAALPVILAIAAAASRHSLWTLPTATTTTAALTIVDQAMLPYRICALLERCKTFHFEGPFSRD